MEAPTTYKMVLVFLLVGSQFVFTHAQGSCLKMFNASSGEATTPGYPNKLAFNSSCVLTFSGGRFKLMFENVSLPNGSMIYIYPAVGAEFTVGTDIVQSRVWYTNHIQYSKVFILFNTTSVGAFSGLRILYEKIPTDFCSYSHQAEANKQYQRFRRDEANITCVCYIDTTKKDNVIQIAIASFKIFPGDDVTFYDGESDVIIARYNTTPAFMEGSRSNSMSMRIVFRRGEVAGFSEVFFSYKEIPKALGSCEKEYYGTSGVLQSPSRDCIFTIIFPREINEMRLKFEDLFIPRDENIVIKQESATRDRFTYLYPRTAKEAYVFSDKNAYSIVITFNASVKFNVSLGRQRKDVCPYYKQAESFFDDVIWPKGNNPNESCTFFIENIPSSPAIHVGVSEFSLGPQDNLTFYDERSDKMLVKYDGSLKLPKFTALNSSYVRVVFTPSNNLPSKSRALVLNYRKFPQDSCVEEYFGETGSIQTPDQDCLIIVKRPNGRTELKFDNLNIVPNEKLLITEKDDYHNVIKVTNLTAQDSGPLKYLISRLHGASFYEIKFNSTTKFNLTFKPFFSTYTVDLKATNGNLLSPHYPATYPYTETLRVTYHVIVPSGHVMLNFTELTLAPPVSYWSDRLFVYDGPSDNDVRLAAYQNTTVKNLPIIVSSNNSLTIKLFSDSLNRLTKNTYRFKAFFTAVSEVKSCIPFNWSHSYPSRNTTLPGRSTIFKCKDNYVDKSKTYGKPKEVKRLCNFGGHWAPGEVLNCLRICPHLDDWLTTNSSVTWVPKFKLYAIYVGQVVTFYCPYGYDMIGPKTITCTSYGNYTMAPPYCKKRPKKDDDDDSSSEGKGWVYGVGIGSAGIIITIVIAVLRICFGCFACFDSANGAAPIELGATNNGAVKN